MVKFCYDISCFKALVSKHVDSKLIMAYTNAAVFQGQRKVGESILVFYWYHYGIVVGCSCRSHRNTKCYNLNVQGIERANWKFDIFLIVHFCSDPLIFLAGSLRHCATTQAIQKVISMCSIPKFNCHSCHKMFCNLRKLRWGMGCTKVYCDNFP